MKNLRFGKINPVKNPYQTINRTFLIRDKQFFKFIKTKYYIVSRPLSLKLAFVKKKWLWTNIWGTIINVNIDLELILQSIKTKSINLKQKILTTAYFTDILYNTAQCLKLNNFNLKPENKVTKIYSRQPIKIGFKINFYLFNLHCI